MQIFREGEEATAGFFNRTRGREKTLMTATMNFVAYFINLDISGDPEETKKLNAEIKVSQISSEVAALIYIYTLGNTQPLIDAINAIDEGTYSFMDTAAKAQLVGDLTPAA